MGELATFADSCEAFFAEAQMGERAAGRLSAVRRDPNNPMPIHELAGAAWLNGRPDLWVQGTALALRLPHETPQSLFVRACAKLRFGDWSGWRDYEARHIGPGTVTSESAYARALAWTATTCESVADLRGKTLLMIEEGGFGDSVQSMCFVPALVTAAERVILLVKPELVTFFEHNFGRVAMIASSDQPLYDGFDEYIWSSSVPTLFEGIPPFEPLSAPDPQLRSRAGAEPLRMGICWAARVCEPHVAIRRSITEIEVLKPLFALADIDWQSLQIGPHAGEIATYPAVRDADPSITTFADLANLVSALDCVVSVDTAVAHLAGRLGIPTYLLLPYAADWRWGLHDTTPWYPSMRLIRQQTPGDWDSAIGLLLREISDRGAAVG